MQLPAATSSPVPAGRAGRTLSAATLLTGVAHLAMFLGVGLAPAEASDACNLVGSTYTCSGNQSGGIWIDKTGTDLYVNGLTGDIKTNGTDGIAFVSNGPITAIIDLGGNEVHAKGTNADGIQMLGYGEGESIYLEATGNVTSARGYGVNVDGFAEVESHTTGTITGASGALRVHSANDGSVIVEHEGNLNSSDGFGVRADGGGSVQVTLNGNIDAGGDGIYAKSWGTDPDGTVTVNFTGGVHASDGDGVVANSTYHSTKVTGNGNVTASNDGIVVQATGSDADSTATLHQTGDVTASSGDGVVVTSAFHAANATISGSVDAGEAGIYVASFGTDSDASASLRIEGNVEADDGNGITVTSTQHSARSTSIGDVTAAGDGILVMSTGTESDATATIESQGHITSTGGRGLYASSTQHSASIKSNGDVEAEDDAITAKSTGSDSDATATVDSNGNVTSHSGSGITATASMQAASVTSRGDVDADVNGIFVESRGSGTSATIYSEGNVTGSSGYGLYAYSTQGHAGIESHGDVSSTNDAIYTKALGGSNDSSSTATVLSYGNLTSTAGRGVYAYSSSHASSFEGHGDIDAYGDGIYVVTGGTAADATSTVNQTGNVGSDTGYGVYATATTHAVVVNVDGDIEAELDGIYAHSAGSDSDATVKVGVIGNITSYTGYGINATAPVRGVDVDVQGDIYSEDTGIYATSTGQYSDSTVLVDVIGNITSLTGYGIYGTATTRSVDIDIQGNIESEDTGIYATTTGATEDATVLIGVNGNITSYDGYGVYANASTHGVTVNTSGDVYAELDGIHAITTGTPDDATINIDADGSVHSFTGYGVYANSSNRSVTVTGASSIEGEDGGIYAVSTGSTNGDSVFVSHSGSVNSSSGDAIYARAANGSVTVSQNGDVTGDDYGIHAKADSSYVAVTYGEDGVLSGAVEAAVFLEGNTKNGLANYGEIDGGDGYAVKTKGYGNTAIDNYGTLSGDIYIDDGYSTVFNMAEGTLNLGDVTFTNGGLVKNEGTLSAGGVGEVATADISNGGFVQTEDGVLVVDIDGSDADLINVAYHAELAGSVAVNFITAADLTSYTILTSDGIDTATMDLNRDGILSTYVMSESDLRVVDGTDLVLDLVVDYRPDTLDERYSDIGQALENAYENDNQDLALLLGQLANLQTKEEYEAALAELGPEIQAQDTTQLAALAGQFTNKLFSCRVQDGAYRFTAEGECQWVSVSHARSVTDATDGAVGFTRDETNISAGGQWAVGDDLRFGVAFGYTSSSSSDDTGATAKGESGEVGAVLKYAKDGVVLGAALTTGWGSTDTERFVSIGNLDQTITGTATSGYVNARLSAGYEFDLGNAYLKPLVNLDLRQSYYDGMTEAGGSAALEISDGSVFNAILSPSLELGGEVALSDTVVARPFVRVGASYSTGNDLVLDANFVGETTTFKLTSESDQIAATLSAGVDVIASDNATVRLFYDGSFGETTRTDSIGFKLSGKIF